MDSTKVSADGAAARAEKTPLWAALALAVLIAVHVLGNAYWIVADNHPISGDEAGQMLNARVFLEIFAGTDGEKPFLRGLYDAARIEDKYPPLNYIVGAMAMGIFGANPDVLSALSSFYFVLLILGVYVLSREFMTPWESVFTALLCSLIPVVFASSRYYSLDYPLMTLTLWAVAAAAKSRGLQRTGWTLACAAAAGLTFLLKPNGLFFWGLPCAAVGIEGLIRVIRHRASAPAPRDARWRFGANVLLGSLLFLLVASPWYFFHWNYITAYWTNPAMPHGGVLSPVSKAIDFRFYPFLLVNLCLFLPLFFLSLTGLLSPVFLRRFRCRTVFMLVLWILGGYVLMTVLITKKEARYILPLVPAMGVFAAMPVVALRGKRARAVAGLAIILLLVGQYLAYTIPLRPERVRGGHWRIGAFELPWPTYYNYNNHHDLFYFGSPRLALFREALIADSYSYYPPWRGANYIECSLRPMVAHMNSHPPDGPGAVRFQTLGSAEKLVGLAAHAKFYAPEPNILAVTRWGGEVTAARPFEFTPPLLAATPEELQEPLPMDGYLVCKFRPGTEEAEDWKRYLTGRGFYLLAEFYDRGYGQSIDGDFLVLAGPSRHTAPATKTTAGKQQ